MDLAQTAARFDAVYSELTLLQRRLIAAQRGELEPSAEKELIASARAFVTAFDAAQRSLSVGGPGPAELERRALATRVLQRPIDDHLLLAALRSQRRADAYPMLAAALRMSTAEMPEGLGRRTLSEFLAAPVAMGARRAHDLLKAWDLPADLLLSDVPADQIESLCERIEDAGEQLPESARPRSQKPAAPADGVGAGDRVLSSWIDASGDLAGGIRPLIATAAQREGWPTDAGPVALLLASVTTDQLLPLLLEERWESIGTLDEEDQIQAVRDQSRSWWRSEDDTQRLLAYLLRRAAELMTTARRLRAFDGNYSTPRPGETPIQLSRKIARRCGEILGCLEPEHADRILAALPPRPRRSRSGRQGG